jgi:hypothetical protein
MAPLGSRPKVCSREEHLTFLEVRGSAEDDPVRTIRWLAMGWDGLARRWHHPLTAMQKKAPSLAGKPGGSRVQSQREDALEEHSGAYAAAPSASSPKLTAAAV